MDTQKQRRFNSVEGLEGAALEARRRFRSIATAPWTPALQTRTGAAWALEHDMVQDELEQRDDLVCGARHVQPVHVVAVHEQLRASPGVHVDRQHAPELSSPCTHEIDVRVSHRAKEDVPFVLHARCPDAALEKAELVHREGAFVGDAYHISESHGRQTSCSHTKAD